MPQHAIQAPSAAAGEGEIKEDEALENRGVPAVQHRKEAARRVARPVGDSHFTGEQERHWSREEAQHQERAADQFKDAANPDIERNSGAGLPSGGKLSHFCVPCSMKISPITMRAIERTRGAQTASSQLADREPVEGSA